jgi:glyoxylase-like metal-dependent hydrolase (beta-lactamase superfamily II)
MNRTNTIRRSILCLLCAISVAHADNPETLVERSQATARTVLDRAVTAIGGEDALRRIDAVQLQLEGDTWPRMQMPTPAPPFEGGSLRETLLIDFKNSRMRLEQQGAGGGFENHNTVVITPEGGTNYDHRARTAMPIPVAQSTQQQFVQYYRRLPNLILRQAIDRTNSLRSLGRDSFDGRPHEVITFVMPDTQQVAVYIDASTSLVSKYELLTVDPLTGEDASEIIFGDYTSVGQLRVPQSWNQRLAGDHISKFRLRAQINPALTATTFSAPSGTFAPVKPLPDSLESSTEQLADGVFVFHNVADQNYNSLAVAMKDHVVVIEAPFSSAGGDRLIQEVKRAIPGKPIRYVVVTHHHSDHIGGLRSLIAEGATIVTTRANVGTLDAMAAAPQIDRLAANPRKAQYVFVEGGKHVLTDGTRSIEVFDIGPNPHAKEMLIAYLPAERVVFQGDMFFKPVNDAPQGPPQAATASFAKRIKELQLRIDRIAGVHGLTATAAEFEAAMKVGT